MNISIKTVTTPFSFFCVAEESKNNEKTEKDKDYEIENPKSTKKINLSDVDHGQYVAVLWKGKWVRGIISMESYFMIWLVDEGIHIRPTADTVYVNLPAEYKKLPSKVFEASIYGVTPVGLELDEMCEFKKETMLSWSMGAVAKAQELIDRATLTNFVPVALLTTKTNDVVLGDLYLELNGRLVNFVDELTKNDSPMHVTLERNMEFYIKNLSKFYTNRRHHRACLLKPQLAWKDLPMITTEITLAEYNAICDEVEQPPHDDFDTDSVGGSSVTYIENMKDVPNKKLKLTQYEIEKYSNQYIVVGGREYNVLTVLLNKARDLDMCEKYKDAKSLGRATTRLTSLSL